MYVWKKQFYCWLYNSILQFNISDLMFAISDYLAGGLPFLIEPIFLFHLFIHSIIHLFILVLESWVLHTLDKILPLRYILRHVGHMSKDNFSGVCSLVFIMSEAGSLLYYRLSGLGLPRDPPVSAPHFMVRVQGMSTYVGSCGSECFQPLIEPSLWAIFLLLF